MARTPVKLIPLDENFKHSQPRHERIEGLSERDHRAIMKANAKAAARLAKDTEARRQRLADVVEQSTPTPTKWQTAEDIAARIEAGRRRVAELSKPSSPATPTAPPNGIGKSYYRDGWRYFVVAEWPDSDGRFWAITRHLKSDRRGKALILRMAADELNSLEPCARKRVPADWLAVFDRVRWRAMVAHTTNGLQIGMKGGK